MATNSLIGNILGQALQGPNGPMSIGQLNEMTGGEFDESQLQALLGAFQGGLPQQPTPLNVPGVIPGTGGVGGVGGTGPGLYVPGYQGDVIDPITGRTIDTSGLREGAEAGRATIGHGFGLDILSEQRRGQALGLLNQVLGDLGPGLQGFAQQSMEQASDPRNLDELGRLLFARGTDSTAASAQATARAISSQIGGRGIAASSPLAAGMAFQNELQRSANVRGVERDVRIELLRRNAQDRASAFNQALSAANFQTGLTRDIAGLTTQVPQYGYDSLTGLTELIIQREGLARGEAAGKRASRNQLIGSAIGGVASIIGAFI